MAWIFLQPFAPTKQTNKLFSTTSISHFHSMRLQKGEKIELNHEIIFRESISRFMIPIIIFMSFLFTYRYELLTVANQKQSKSLGDLLEMVSQNGTMLDFPTPFHNYDLFHNYLKLPQCGQKASILLPQGTWKIAFLLPKLFTGFHLLCESQQVIFIIPGRREESLFDCVA